MIVVIDSNVWISALLSQSSQSKPRRVIERVIVEGKVGVCEPIESEIKRILTTKFGWTLERARANLSATNPLPTRVPIFGNIRVCRDPDDNMVLECAINSGAEVIVTGDKDLLALDQYQNVRIMTPADFLKL